MSDTQARYHLTKLKRNYRALRFAETLAYAIAVTTAAFAGLYAFGVPLPANLPLSSIGGVLFFYYHSLKLNLFHITEQNVALYLNKHFPALQNSSDLFLANSSDLTGLQVLQKERTVLAFDAVYPSIKLPNNILKAITLLFVSAALCILVMSYTPWIDGTHPSSSDATTSETSTSVVPPLPAAISDLSIRIVPPSYTGIAPNETENPTLRLPEGSAVQWTLSFKGSVKNAAIIFSGKETSKLIRQAANNFSLTTTLYQTGFYQLSWTDESNGQQKNSDFYKIEIIKDQAPVITVHKLNQFTEMDFASRLLIDLHATVSDDYGLDSAHIIATVSKGSGESVKFREDKLYFETPKNIQDKRMDAMRKLNLNKMGMEPGDELYFYIVAFDNKHPQRNRTRTETYFISLRDTTRQETVVDDGLGVDLMPDYFRSQRQIIIDTEKLLKERKQLTPDKFKSKSNELGYDQKVLRLRYGEFLGEEFESGIGPHDAAPDDDHAEEEEEEDVTKKYGHVHDTENEHNLVQEKSPAHQHEHHAEGDDEDKNGIPKEFVHQHDNEEEATFFTQSIRAKLKAALTLMWDAELHLRLYEPQQSLPFQYKALKLLKEISQDSRIYVHRTGFDPPPLKEEKRLTGDLSEVKSGTTMLAGQLATSFPAVREASQRIAYTLSADTIELTDAARKALAQAGRELGVLAVQQPGIYLKSLSLIRAMVDNEIAAQEQRKVLTQIQAVFWTALPMEQTSPAARTQTLHPLDESFIKNLNGHE